MRRVATQSDRPRAGVDMLKHKVVPGAPEHTIVLMPGDRAVVDRADLMSADREHSEQNPSSVEYERDALPVELDQAGSSLGFKPRSERLHVRQLTPSVRARELLKRAYK
jgi:hypothetical protein